jgi:hypothetical protein
MIRLSEPCLRPKLARARFDVLYVGGALEIRYRPSLMR